jgi:hypothetical protein
VKRSILLSLAAIPFAGMLGGCFLSAEVHNPPQVRRCSCPTDFIASWGQDVYYGRYTPCFSDGHAVPVTFPEHCDYTTGVSTSMNTRVTVSGNVSGTVTHD